MITDTEREGALSAVRADPVGCVKRMAEPAQRDFMLLSALSLSAQDRSIWNDLRDAGILTLFIELLVDEWSSPESLEITPGWVFAMTGIINVLVAVKKDDLARGGKSSEENIKQNQIVIQAYPRIEATLWKLKDSAIDEESLATLALGLYHFSRVPGLSPLLYTPHTLALVTHCWTESKITTSRKVSCVSLVNLMTSAQAPSHAIQSLYTLLPFPQVSSRLISLFTDPVVTNDPSQLATELAAADVFVAIGNPEGPKFVGEAKIHCHLVALIGSQMEKIKSRDNKWLVVNSAGPFLNNIINAAADPGRALEELIHHHAFMLIASEALVLLSSRQDSYDSPWFRIFKMLIHTARCSDIECRVRHSPTFLPIARTAFDMVYIPVLDIFDEQIAKSAFTGGVVEDASEDSSVADRRGSINVKEDASLWQSILSWRALAAVLNMSEDVLRGTRPAPPDSKDGGPGDVCWWTKCKSGATTKTEAGGEVVTTFKRCSGCHMVKYCSPEHQALDWKKGGHKEVCVIVKNA